MGGTAGGDSAEVGRMLRLQCARIEDIQQQASALMRMEWISPAGMNFRRYLDEQLRALARARNLVEDAAQLVESNALEPPMRDFGAAAHELP